MYPTNHMKMFKNFRNWEQH